MEQKAAQTSTLWPKTAAELVTMNVENFQERQNASIGCGPTALVLEKIRHVGQRQKQSWQQPPLFENGFCYAIGTPPRKLFRCAPHFCMGAIIDSTNLLINVYLLLQAALPAAA